MYSASGCEQFHESFDGAAVEFVAEVVVQLRYGLSIRQPIGRFHRDLPLPATLRYRKLQTTICTNIVWLHNTGKITQAFTGENMHKVIVLYHPPKDSQHFRDYYEQKHLPLAAKLPGLESSRHSFNLVSPAGAPALFLHLGGRVRRCRHGRGRDAVGNRPARRRGHRELRRRRTGALRLHPRRGKRAVSGATQGFMFPAARRRTTGRRRSAAIQSKRGAREKTSWTMGSKNSRGSES